MSEDIDFDTAEATLGKMLDEIWRRAGRKWRVLQDDPVGADLFSAIKRMGCFLYAIGGRSAMHEIANVRIIRPMPWDARRRNFIAIVDHVWDGIGAGADCWRA